MAVIYQLAQSVVAWLGEDVEAFSKVKVLTVKEKEKIFFPQKRRNNLFQLQRRQ